MKDPLVSVIFAVHNNEHSIGRCLECLLNQDYKNIEIMAVDDFSTDNTSKIMKEILPRSHSYKYIFNKKQIGEKKSLAEGLKFANGELVYFSASDMYISSGSLKSAVQYLQKQHENVAAITGSIYNFDQGYWSILRHISQFGGFQKNKIKEVDTFPLCNVIVRKQVIEKSKYMWNDDKRYVRCFDVAYSTNLKEKGYKIIYFPGLEVRHDHPTNFHQYINFVRKAAEGYVDIRKANPEIHYNFMKHKYRFFALLPILPFGSTMKKIFNGQQKDIMVKMPLFMIPLFFSQVYFWHHVYKNLVTSDIK